MTTHEDHHYSISVLTDDVAVLYCLRALADLAQKSGNTRIVWANTKLADWKASNQMVTFHFSSPDYRGEFVSYAQRILPPGSWRETRRNDNDPARRAR